MSTRMLLASFAVLMLAFSVGCVSGTGSFNMGACDDCGPVVKGGGKGGAWQGVRPNTYCDSGCGETYVHEWLSDPPDQCDPCNKCGDYIGPRSCEPRMVRLWRTIWGQQSCKPVRRCGLIVQCGCTSVGGKGAIADCGGCGDCGMGGMAMGAVVTEPGMVVQPAPQIIPGSPAEAAPQTIPLPEPEEANPQGEDVIEPMSYRLQSRNVPYGKIQLQ